MGLSERIFALSYIFICLHISKSTTSASSNDSFLITLHVAIDTGRTARIYENDITLFVSRVNSWYETFSKNDSRLQLSIISYDFSGAYFRKFRNQTQNRWLYNLFQLQSQDVDVTKQPALYDAVESISESIDHDSPSIDFAMLVTTGEIQNLEQTTDSLRILRNKTMDILFIVSDYDQDLDVLAENLEQPRNKIVHMDNLAGQESVSELLENTVVSKSRNFKVPKKSIVEKSERLLLATAAPSENITISLDQIREKIAEFILTTIPPKTSPEITQVTFLSSSTINQQSKIIDFPTAVEYTLTGPDVTRVSTIGVRSDLLKILAPVTEQFAAAAAGTTPPESTRKRQKSGPDQITSTSNPGRPNHLETGMRQAENANSKHEMPIGKKIEGKVEAKTQPKQESSKTPLLIPPRRVSTTVQPKSTGFLDFLNRYPWKYSRERGYYVEYTTPHGKVTAVPPVTTTQINKPDIEDINLNDEANSAEASKGTDHDEFEEHVGRRFFPEANVDEPTTTTEPRSIGTIQKHQQPTTKQPKLKPTQEPEEPYKLVPPIHRTAEVETTTNPENSDEEAWMAAMFALPTTEPSTTEPPKIKTTKSVEALIEDSFKLPTSETTPPAEAESRTEPPWLPITTDYFPLKSELPLAEEYDDTFTTERSEYTETDSAFLDYLFGTTVLTNFNISASEQSVTPNTTNVASTTPLTPTIATTEFDIWEQDPSTLAPTTTSKAAENITKTNTTTVPPAGPGRFQWHSSYMYIIIFLLFLFLCPICLSVCWYLCKRDPRGQYSVMGQARPPMPVHMRSTAEHPLMSEGVYTRPKRYAEMKTYHHKQTITV